MEKLYSRKEAASVLGVSLPTLDTARERGLIAYVQYTAGGCVYFTEQAMTEYIVRCTQRAKPNEYHNTSRHKRKDVKR